MCNLWVLFSRQCRTIKWRREWSVQIMARSDWSILITLSKCCHLIDYTPKVRLTGNVGVSKMYSLSQELFMARVSVKRYNRLILSWRG